MRGMATEVAAASQSSRHKNLSGVMTAADGLVKRQGWPLPLVSVLRGTQKCLRRSMSAR